MADEAAGAADAAGEAGTPVAAAAAAVKSESILSLVVRSQEGEEVCSQ